jgi:hypothetical protein
LPSGFLNCAAFVPALQRNILPLNCKMNKFVQMDAAVTGIRWMLGQLHILGTSVLMKEPMVLTGKVGWSNWQRKCHAITEK